MRRGPARAFLSTVVAGAVLIAVGTAILLAGRGWETADRMASVFSLFVGFCALLLGLWQAQRASTQAPATLARIVEGLAARTTREWEHEERVRRIHDPAPLPVRWQNADERLMDHWPSIRRGMSEARLDMSGTLADIEEAFIGVPSHRLVVLGRGGSGKTILTLRFVLDSLQKRGPRDPVPVAFSLASWNPSRTRLERWLADRLAITYPALGTIVDRRETAADRLLSSRRILPVLDGFDEIAAGSRATAIEEINFYCRQPNAPLLLTSRPDEFADAVQEAGPVRGAGVVHLQDLTLADLEAYLPLTTRRTSATEERKWDSVLEYLARAPDGKVARSLMEALGTPLMVSLARTIYSDTDQRPRELVSVCAQAANSDEARREAVEEHLLGEFVPAVYAHELDRDGAANTHWNPARVHRWLGFLARHVRERGLLSVMITDPRNQTTDLAWWQLHRASRWEPTLFAIGVSTLLGLVAWGTLRAITGLVWGSVLSGFLLLCAFAVTGYFLSEERLPVHARFRFEEPIGRALVRGILLSLPFSTLLGAGIVLSGVAHGAQIATGIGLGLGLGAALVLVGNEVFTNQIDVDRETSPRSALIGDRNSFLIRMPFTCAAASFGVGLAGMSWLGTAPGITLGALVAWIAVLVMVPQSAWVRYSVTHLMLAASGRLPFRLFAFLDDAHRRGVFRQAGAVYHFRHARLQHRLAGGDQAGRRSRR